MKLPKIRLPKLATVRKALVPLVTVVAQLATLGVFHGRASVAAIALLGVASSVGVYAVRNANPVVAGLVAMAAAGKKGANALDILRAAAAGASKPPAPPVPPS